MRGVRQDVIAASHGLHARGWVANHDGNITVRIGANRFLATPTATSKADVDAKNLIEVDDRGTRVAGTARPFGELALHLAVYRARPDVNAVVHAHPPYATAIACSGSTALAAPFIAEAVVSIGASIPTLPFDASAEATATAIAAAAEATDAVLIAANGAFAWGADLEQARLRLELVEHLARIATLALAHGGVSPLPPAAVAKLLERRASAGLGAAASKAIAKATAPSDDGKRAALVSAIREEVIAVLAQTEQ